MATEQGFDWGVISATGVIFTIASAVGTFLFTRGGREALLKQQIESMQKVIDAANTRADKAETANAELRAQLAAHMVADAAAFAELKALTAESARGSTASELRLTGAIDKLVTRIDGLANQFTTFVQRFSPALANISPPTISPPSQ